MKNQALVTAVSGLLIGGFGIANRINALSIAGTGLLTSSVVITLIAHKKQNQSTSQITTTIPQAPKKPQVKQIEKPKLVKKPQVIKKSQPKKTKKPKLVNKPLTIKNNPIKPTPRPIRPSNQSKSIEKPILKPKKNTKKR